MLSRRVFNGLLGATAMSAALSRPALGGAKARIVVVGAGAGGATLAKVLAKGAPHAFAITLIEPETSYVSCFHSNLVIGGFKPIGAITHSYDRLASAYGIEIVRDRAIAIDRSRREVRLSGGQSLPYDRLVVSPGIDLRYDSVPGWGKEHEEELPHGWKAGRQTVILQDQLAAVPDGGLILILAPPNPYRCPAAPYERASVMACALKAAGKSRCKIIILDPKDKFSMQALFQDGWDTYYPGMIEWINADMYDTIDHVDPATRSVSTGFENYKNAAMINVIPAQMAGAVAANAALVDETGFCPVDPRNMTSIDDANIQVIGDATVQGDMPKSASAASSHAKVAAHHLLSEIAGLAAGPASFANVCWSMINVDDTVKVGGTYEPKDGRITTIESFVSQLDETPEIRRQTQQEGVVWYNEIMTDILG